MWAQQALDFVKAHGDWAPWVVFALAFGESIAVISLLIPATFILVGLGALVEAGNIPLLPVWAGAVAGGVFGDALSYWIGLMLKERTHRVWPFRKYPEMLDRGERFFKRYGVWGVVIGRFFGPLRAVVPLVAGAFSMPTMIFMLANVTSAMAWAFLLLAPGAAAMRMLGW